ncbi:Uncharacterised protein [Staphylococcus haemolyticus]|nr:Uncharacterised protein [Staphylococcus haemolyticus]
MAAKLDVNKKISCMLSTGLLKMKKKLYLKVKVS